MALIIAFSGIVWAIATVIRARGPRHYVSSSEDGHLLWQDHVLSYKSPDRYFRAVQDADANLMLRNLTDEVFTLASISSEKMAGLALAKTWLWTAVVCWSINLISSFVLAG
jgi:hypothetical protein